ncbi:M15 family metallopeptidase [Pararhizobium sp. LjRoot235]|uniref:peptidoglycan-binding protein n=1 Tax=Pararhizobium sp. LjRoot235 TaxID=3342291 RepID=UPI003ECC24E5
MVFEKWLQSRLTAHGYPVGPIDGFIGEDTIGALKAFEKANGLRADGTADPVLVQALRASASAVPPKMMADIPNRDIAPEREVFQPSKAIWPRQSDCMAYYGPVAQNQKQIEVPFDMYLAWSKSTRLKRMTLHSRVAESALQVLQRVGALYSAAERRALGVDLFGGSLNVRKMRGGNSYSMHSWGIAIDFDPERNQLNVHRPNARLSHPDAVAFWVAWESASWLSLGRARDFDWMHVQAARL